MEATLGSSSQNADGPLLLLHLYPSTVHIPFPPHYVVLCPYPTDKPRTDVVFFFFLASHPFTLVFLLLSSNAASAKGWLKVHLSVCLIPPRVWQAFKKGRKLLRWPRPPPSPRMSTVPVIAQRDTVGTQSVQRVQVVLYVRRWQE